MPEPACQKITFAQMRAAGVRGVPSVLRVRGQKSCTKATITEIYATLPRKVEVGARTDAAQSSA